MISNTEIENALELCGKLMELHGENTFKSKSYHNAAFQISKVGTALQDMTDAEIANIPGIGQSMIDKIHSLLKTGTLPVLTELLHKTPEGVIQLMHIKGLGPKKVATIWKELGIESIGELEYACRENRLTLLKGFGAKTQKSVLDSIEFIKLSAGKVHYAVIEKDALEFEAHLKSIFPENQTGITGSFRRRDIIIDRLDYITDVPTQTAIERLSTSFACEKINDTLIQVSGLMIPTFLTCCSPSTFIAALFQTTGSPEFIHQFDSIDYSKHYPDEAEIFQAAGLRFLIPEMRNGSYELQWLKNYANDKPIDTPDIKGIIHAHSTWSDGIHSIEEMALYCMQSGWEYLIISDHSASAFYAQGLKSDRVIAQHKEIDALNHKLAPFKIFKSIESDILIDGSLDYPDEILERFDCIIASVHSTLNMDLDKATNRLLRAIENPFTTILGHPTGRLLLSRSGYPIDTKKIIDACARNKVVIELNANPWRLDIDWSWIYEAMDRGVQIAINPDAHSLAGIHDIHYGTLAARKGGLIKKFLFNNLNVNEMTAYLEKRKSAIFKK